MSKEKEVTSLILQPYGYSKNFARNKITVSQNRVVIQIIKQIKVHQHRGGFQLDLFNPRDVNLFFDAKDLVINNATDRIEDILEGLRAHRLDLPYYDDEGRLTERRMGFISTFDRRVADKGTNKGKVAIKVDEKLFKYLCDLSHGYTAFLEDTAFSLSNSYAIKMYYHICHWFRAKNHINSNEQLSDREKAQKHGNQVAKYYKIPTNFTLSNFKKEFNVPEKYRTIDIKRYILDPAKKELDTKSEVSFNYTENKEGRKITGFSFVFYSNIPKNGKNIKRTIKLSKLEQEFLNNAAITHNFTKEEKTRFVGMIKKYTVNFIITCSSTCCQEIDKYISWKKVRWIDAIGYILEGEYKKVKAMKIENY